MIIVLKVQQVSETRAHIKTTLLEYPYVAKVHTCFAPWYLTRFMYHPSYPPFLVVLDTAGCRQ
jgi:hypothetical protein